MFAPVLHNDSHELQSKLGAAHSLLHKHLCLLRIRQHLARNLPHTLFTAFQPAQFDLSRDALRIAPLDIGYSNGDVLFFALHILSALLLCQS